MVKLLGYAFDFVEFMGSGKTTLGKVAEKLGKPFCYRYG